MSLWFVDMNQRVKKPRVSWWSCAMRGGVGHARLPLCLFCGHRAERAGWQDTAPF